MIIVSACLAGVKCRYDGKDNACPKIKKLVEQGTAIPVCPEQLGGLPTPRTPAEPQGNHIFDQNGYEVTKYFHKGAQEALNIALLAKCDQAIVKAKSPSCGSGHIYDGTFSHTLIPGDGFFTQLLKKHRIKVFTEKEI